MAADAEFTISVGANFRQASFDCITLKIGEEVKIISDIESGLYGSVAKGKHIPTSCSVAVKRANPLKSAAFAEINRELQALSILRHPGIPQLFEAYQTNFGYFLVMELIEGETLYSTANSVWPGSEPLASKIFMQLADVLHYLHSSGGVHRDLHARNIMITPKEEVKLIDFGHCLKIDDVRVKRMGGYSSKKAPERMFEDRPMGASGEVFSLGRLMYKYMCDGTEPFPDEENVVKLIKVMQAPPRQTYPFRRLSPDAQNIIRACLAFRVEDRITLPAFLEHPFIMKARETLGVRRAAEAPRYMDHVSNDPIEEIVQETKALHEKRKTDTQEDETDVLEIVEEQLQTPELMTYNILKYKALKDGISCVGEATPLKGGVSCLVEAACQKDGSAQETGTSN
eukprot:scpid74237/ scgid1880/ Maternal embryonic leucine zipper kinase; Protein kinase Eg3; Protein kinase PK38; Tyrosine-protein kinase MELK